ncbi:MAG: FMN-binding negative transcriptional regulator [Bacteroidota bacterium]
MYLPAHFRETDRGKLFRFVQEYNFGALVSVHDGLPFATHIPFLLDESGESGMLTGHIARANPQWRDVEDGREALVIFQGPHGYITPSWYQEELSVPTWNYTAVHIYGVPRIITDPDALLGILERLVERQERGFERQWKFDSSAEWIRSQVTGIIGLEIPIARMEGKLKLNQNRSEEDRVGVIAALGESGHHGDNDLASFMRLEPGVCPIHPR